MTIEAETSASQNFYLGAGDDTVIAGTGNDVIYGGLGADRLAGRGGADVFAYSDIGFESSGAAFDTVTDFVAGQDKFQFKSDTILGVDPTVASGTLTTAAFDSDLAAAVGAGQLAAHHAVLFTPSAGDYVGHTFLVVDANGMAGYHMNVDYTIDVTGYTGTLALSSFI